MAVPSDTNTSLKIIAKLCKYKDLDIETTRMWGMKTETVPVVIGALGLIEKGLQKHTEKFPGAININDVQKNNFIRNSPHTKEGFVLKAKFISPVVP